MRVVKACTTLAVQDSVSAFANFTAADASGAPKKAPKKEKPPPPKKEAPPAAAAPPKEPKQEAKAAAPAPKPSGALQLRHSIRMLVGASMCHAVYIRREEGVILDIKAEIALKGCYACLLLDMAGDGPDVGVLSSRRL